MIPPAVVAIPPESANSPAPSDEPRPQRRRRQRRAATAMEYLVAASFILGHPQDTLDTVSETIVFARRIIGSDRRPSLILLAIDVAD